MGTTGSAPESLGLCSLQTPPPMRPLPRSPQPRMGSGAASVPPGPQPRLQPGGGGVAPPTEPAGPDLTLGAQRVAGASECQRASRVLSPSARSEPFPSTGIPRAPTLCAALAGTCTSHAGRASGGRGSARAGQPTAPQPLLLPLRLPRGQGCQAVPLPPLQCPPLPAESPACQGKLFPTLRFQFLCGAPSLPQTPLTPARHRRLHTHHQGHRPCAPCPSRPGPGDSRPFPLSLSGWCLGDGGRGPGEGRHRERPRGRVARTELAGRGTVVEDLLAWARSKGTSGTV